jgi:hypothetical protein
MGMGRAAERIYILNAPPAASRRRPSADPHAVFDFNQIADAARWLEWYSFSELAAVLGYFFGMITAFTAVVALAIGLFNITAAVNGPRHYPRPVIARTVTVETQRHSAAAKEASPAKDVSPVVAKADAKKSKHYKPKVLARQPNNYGYGNALGYAQESRYSPRGLFFR